MSTFRNIMLIDDDEDDQEIFLTALQEISPAINCTLATNGRHALDQLTTKKVTPELIFLDLNMPLMDGRQFLQIIKNTESEKDIPVYIFSTSSDQGTINETLKLGAHAFYTKPEKFDRLKDILRTILL